MRHAAHGIVDHAVLLATETEPDRIGSALRTVLSDGGALADFGAPALSALLKQDDGEQLAHELARGAAATRAALAGALSGTTEPWADELLAELALDEEERVRSAAAHAAGWTLGASAARIEAGLRACLPANLPAALSLLGGLSRQHGGDQPGALSKTAAATVQEVAIHAACEPHLDETELVEVAKLSGIPRLMLDACLARISWLANDPAEDFAASFARDALPDELGETARKGATDADRMALLDLVEKPDLDSGARSAATTVLSWIDDDRVVTERLGTWLATDDQHLHQLASELLRETRDPARFKTRVRALLGLDLSIDLTETILDAREPAWLTGSERVVYTTLADEFEEWADDPDPYLAVVGRTAAARFRAYAETADDTGEPDETEWG